MLNPLLGPGDATRNQICCMSPGRQTFVKDAGWAPRGCRELSAMGRVTIESIIQQQDAFESERGHSTNYSGMTGDLQTPGRGTTARRGRKWRFPQLH